MSLHELFTRHPADVGETYGQHSRFAAVIGLKMLWGGAACLAHAAFPFLCQSTGSSVIRDLHRTLDTHRPSQAAAQPAGRGAPAERWELDYSV